MLELQVHLFHRLLHMQHVPGPHLHQILTVAQQRSCRADYLLGPERAPQQPDRVQIL
jgi:hypothetical protein